MKWAVFGPLFPLKLRISKFYIGSGNWLSKNS